MGYIEMTEGFGPNSLSGNKHVLQINDVTTNFKYVLPVKTPDAHSTTKAMSHVAGGNTVSGVYSDSGAGIVSACDEMGILRDPSQPKNASTQCLNRAITSIAV